MNREAAALGIPVYSIFRGKIGDVDRYLSESGRLVLLESAGDVREKLALQKRDTAVNGNKRSESPALKGVVAGIVKAFEQARKEKDPRRL